MKQTKQNSCNKVKLEQKRADLHNKTDAGITNNTAPTTTEYYIRKDIVTTDRTYVCVSVVITVAAGNSNEYMHPG